MGIINSFKFTRKALKEMKLCTDVEGKNYYLRWARAKNKIANQGLVVVNGLCGAFAAAIAVQTGNPVNALVVVPTSVIVCSFLALGKYQAGLYFALHLLSTSKDGNILKAKKLDDILVGKKLTPSASPYPQG